MMKEVKINNNGGEEKERDQISEPEHEKVQGPEEDTVESIRKEAEEYRDKYIRLLAEFDNYRKRMEKELQEVRESVALSVIRDFLGVLDSLEKAFEAGKKYKDAIVDGIELTIKSFREMLNKYGVSEISYEGEEFDPSHHEALMMQSSEKPKNTVIKVLEKGYKTDKRLIRPAKVVVSSGSDKKNNGEKEE